MEKGTNTLHFLLLPESKGASLKALPRQAKRKSKESTVNAEMTSERELRESE